MSFTLIARSHSNFMKIAPVIHAIQKAQNEGEINDYRLMHTDQHYDQNRSVTFLKEFNILAPDANMGSGVGRQTQLTSAIMVAFEKELLAHPVDLAVVIVTYIMACSIVAKKLNTKAAKEEAGIRPWDLSMPEEINLMVTDALADYFFTTTELANENLRNMTLRTDDLWLNIMCLKNNTKVVSLAGEYNRFYIPVFHDNDKRLMDSNIGEGQNDLIFNQLMEYYQIPLTIFEN